MKRLWESVKPVRCECSLIRRPCAPCELAPAGIPGLLAINSTPYEVEIIGELPPVGCLEIDGYRLTKGNGEAHDLCLVNGRWECTCGDWIFRRSVLAEPSRSDCKHIHAIRQLGLPQPRDSYAPDLHEDDVITLAETEDVYVTVNGADTADGYELDGIVFDNP
jgi:hypothetical protein